MPPSQRDRGGRSTYPETYFSAFAELPQSVVSMRELRFHCGKCQPSITVCHMFCDPRASFHAMSPLPIALHLLLPSATLPVPSFPQTSSSMALGLLPALQPMLCCTSSLLPFPPPSLLLFPIPAAIPPPLLLSPSLQLPSTSLHTPSDYSKGFGGRYGVERDKVDKAAVGFDYKSQAEKHDSQKDYSVGFGGKFGVQRDRQDKSALGWDHQEEVQPHASQTDYARGFGGRYGVQKDRVDKSAAGFDEMEGPTSRYEKTQPVEAASSGASSLRSRFENMAKLADEESRRRVEEERARRQAREDQAARRKQEIPQREMDHTEPPPAPVPARVPARAEQEPMSRGEQEAKGEEEEETAPALPPRQADLTEEEEQPIYSETFDGGDYEELLERSDYCDSVSAGADYEELPGPVGKPGATYSLGEEDEGADYDEVIPEESSQSQPCSGGMDNIYEVESPGICAVALYDYQGDGDDEISFDPNDTITHIEMVDEGWWKGQCHGKVGLFPANYVKLLQ